MFYVILLSGQDDDSLKDEAEIPDNEPLREQVEKLPYEPLTINLRDQVDKLSYNLNH